MPEWSDDIRKRLEGLRLDPAREASIVEEISQHLDDRYEDLVARGASPEAARRSALEELAGPALSAALKGALPRPAPSRTPPLETDGGLLQGLGKDFRYGARRLRLEPGFALIAILSLALGIGANTAIFQLLDAVRLRNLPIARPAELLNVRIGPGQNGRTGCFSGHFPELTSLLWDRIRSDQKAFSKIAVWSADRLNLASGGEARMAEALWVSGTFFDTVGVGPLEGRLLGPADDSPGCASPSVVLERALLAARARRRPIRPGDTIALEGRPVRDRGRHARAVLRNRGRARLRRRSAHLRRRPHRATSRARRAGRSGGSPSSGGWPGWTVEQANAHLAAISRGSSRRRCRETTTPTTRSTSSHSSWPRCPPRRASRTCARTTRIRSGCCSGSRPSCF